MTKKSAIIVLRHGCDGGNGDKGNFTFDDKVSLSFHGKDGKIEGNQNRPKWVNKWNY